MYSKNTFSVKKRFVVDGLKTGKNFDKSATELRIAKATAEVYGIDGLAAGEHLDQEVIAKYLNITTECFERIKREIMSNKDRKLRTIRDNFTGEFSYNQIRFVLACLIQDMDL